MSERTYTIYHIPGVKVGCTIDFEKRKSQYEEGTVFEVLEELAESVGDKFVGDREWWWADYFGYPRGYHYTGPHWKDLTIGQRREFQKASIKAQLAKGTHNTQTGKSPAHTGKINRHLGGKKTGELGLTPFQTGAAVRGQIAKGIHVNQLGKSGWQTGAGNRASSKSPKRISKQIITCPCGKSGNALAMKRWHREHFENYQDKEDFMCDEPPIMILEDQLEQQVNFHQDYKKMQDEWYDVHSIVTPDNPNLYYVD